MHKALIITALIIMPNSYAVHKSKCELKEKHLEIAHYDPTMSIDASLSAGGQLFAQVSLAGPVFIWDLLQPEKLKAVVVPDEKIAQRFTRTLFSPTARFIAIDSTLPNVALLEHGMLTIFEIASGRPIAEFNTSTFAQEGHSTFIFSPQEKYLALVLDNKSDAKIVTIFDLEKRCSWDIKNLSSCSIGALAFDTSENLLAVKDICEGDITLWDLNKDQATTKLTQKFNFRDEGFSPVKGIKFFGNNNYIAEHSTAQDLMQVWDLRTKESIFETSWLDFQPIITSFDRNSLVVADLFGQLTILQAFNTNIITAMPFAAFDLVGAAAYNPQGNLLAAASVQSEIAILESINYSTSCEAIAADNSSVEQFSFINQNSFITLYESGLLSLWHITN